MWRDHQTHQQLDKCKLKKNETIPSKGLARIREQARMSCQWSCGKWEPLALLVERRTPETLWEDKLAELSRIYLWVKILINKFLQGYGPLYKFSTGLLDCRVLENIWLCASRSWVSNIWWAHSGVQSRS